MLHYPYLPDSYGIFECITNSIFFKNEEKQQIAILLVNEIRNAERAIRVLKDRERMKDLPEMKILPQNNWSKYSQLFAKDFDQDEMQLLNEFYSDVETIHSIVSYGNGLELFLLNIKSRTEAIHNAIVYITQTTQTGEQTRDKVREFTQNLENSTYHYSPQGFNNTLDIYLDKVTFITKTPTGSKLKRLAGYGSINF